LLEAAKKVYITHKVACNSLHFISGNGIDKSEGLVCLFLAVWYICRII